MSDKEQENIHAATDLQKCLDMCLDMARRYGWKLKAIRPTRDLILKVEQFNSANSEMRIVVCYCQYQAIDIQWEPLQRGKPVDEMLSAEVAEVR